MVDKKPAWVKMKSEEIERLVIQLHKEGNSPAKIGIILRDKYGIPNIKAQRKKISKILRDNNLKVETIKDITKKKIEILEKHLSKNKHDYSAQRSLTKKLWIINK